VKSLAAYVLGALLLGSTAANACMCAASPEAKTTAQITAEVRAAVQGAAAVFSGKVIGVDALSVTFVVDSVWKGSVTRLFVMSTGAVANADGTMTISSCDFSFREGRSYVVFAHPAGDKGALHASACELTADLKDAPDTPDHLDRVATRKTLSSPGGLVSDRSRRRGAPAPGSRRAPPPREERRLPQASADRAD
jgi:hypothetical protein